MNGKPATKEEIDGIMELWTKGLVYKDIGKEFGRSSRSIETIVTRHRNTWTRNFNFPHIIHAKRFGADANK